jgi:hypothetical protein
VIDPIATSFAFRLAQPTWRLQRRIGSSISLRHSLLRPGEKVGRRSLVHHRRLSMQEEDSSPGAAGRQFSKMFDSMEIKSANRTPRARQWASCGLIVALCWTFALNCTKAIAALKSKSEHYLQGKRWKWSRLLPIVGRGTGGVPISRRCMGRSLGCRQPDFHRRGLFLNQTQARRDMTHSRRYTGRRQRYPANPICSRLRFASHSGFTGLDEGY